MVEAAVGIVGRRLERQRHDGVALRVEEVDQDELHPRDAGLSQLHAHVRVHEDAATALAARAQVQASDLLDAELARHLDVPQVLGDVDGGDATHRDTTKFHW